MDTKEYLEMIYRQNNKAIILNGYLYDNIEECETITELTRLIRDCYENKNILRVFIEQREVVLTEKDKKNIAEATQITE